MGCEERHTLEKGLEESRAALKKLSSHEKLQHYSHSGTIAVPDHLTEYVGTIIG